MPIHDWTQVDAGIFHHFHLCWFDQIQQALNSGILPSDYYALAEQQVGKLEPDVLTLRGLSGPRGEGPDVGPDGSAGSGGGVGLQHARPQTTLRVETDLAFTQRKQRVVTVRHVSGDDVVAWIEIVSPGNKDSRRALRQFVDKTTWLMERRIHLLIVDLLPPTPRDPSGIHGAIWEEFSGQEFHPSEGKPLTLVAYECDLNVTAYIEPVAVGDRLPAMPLFLQPGAYVEVPLEATYREAFAAVPRRWRAVLEPEA